MTYPSPIKIAISACLLGESVRFNGGHKASSLCLEVLAPYFDFMPLCPEVAIGLGVPREPIRLVGTPQAPQAVGTRHPEHNHTAALSAYGQAVAQQRLDQVCGHILMQKSPSCGLMRVKVYQENGYPAGTASGLYAAALARECPELPMEEEGRLNDPILCENFLVRVFAYAQWKNLSQTDLTHQAILNFHTHYKFQLLAHDPVQYKALGRLLADVGHHAPQDIGTRYIRQFMQALKKPATRGTHSNALQHLSGYLKGALDASDRQEIHRLIQEYRQGQIPLVVPLTLLKHHLRKHPDTYLANQAYLQPYPEGLTLRNAI